MTVVLRTALEPTSLGAAVRREVLAIDPDLPIYNVRTMQELVYNSLAGPRFNVLLLSIFGGIALALAAIGIYGVIAYSVSQRTHEMGLRMAMGAQARDVIRLVLREVMAVALIGVAAGLVVALVATRVLMAAYIPARRATRVDPMVALRCE